MLDSKIKIIELSSGELLKEVQAPETHPILRQALIGADGTIAFMGVAMGDGGLGDPPESAAIFILPPFYEGEPTMVLKDARILNLIGWAGPGFLLVDGNKLELNRSPDTTPSELMLIEIETGIGQWLIHDASGFVSLIP